MLFSAPSPFNGGPLGGVRWWVHYRPHSEWMDDAISNIEGRMTGNNNNNGPNWVQEATWIDLGQIVDHLGRG